MDCDGEIDFPVTKILITRQVLEISNPFYNH